MQRKKAFTLIELLVVIAVIALLMSILMPALHRVKRQAKAVVCMTRLRQWGLWFPMYTQDNDDKFFGGWMSNVNDSLSHAGWAKVMQPYYKDSSNVLLCPTAVKPNSPQGPTFSAWRNWGVYASYGLNRYVRNDPDIAPYSAPVWHLPCWKTSLVKGANNVPVFMDCAKWRVTVTPAPPPRYEVSNRTDGPLRFFCINRHDAHVNGLFMDWSVRKVGLKELWTLKWQRDYNTAGPWTRAGGVKPEDWPEWMRKFKDY